MSNSTLKTKALRFIHWREKKFGLPWIDRRGKPPEKKLKELEQFRNDRAPVDKQFKYHERRGIGVFD